MNRLHHAWKTPATRVDEIVPPVAGWRSSMATLTNLLIFGLVALGGEWCVHQLHYALVYGSHSGTVIVGSSQHTYLGPLGLLLGSISTLLLGLAALTLCLNRLRQFLLLQGLPAYRLWRDADSFGASANTLTQTAIVLVAYQVVIYFLQENVESALVGHGWPWLGVLFAAPNIGVIPLHMLAAAIGSILLWTVCTALQRSSRLVAEARARAAALTLTGIAATQIASADVGITKQRYARGLVCSRAPPCANWIA